MHQPAELGANKGLAIIQALVVTLLCHFLAPPYAPGLAGRLVHLPLTPPPPP
jgi:hypothetical protein